MLLQEVSSELTFVHLCEMFQESPLIYSHFQHCCYTTPDNCQKCSCVAENNLAVFSRWPLSSVNLRQFDTITSQPVLQKRYSNFWSLFAPKSKAKFGDLNKSNAVQYVRINLKNCPHTSNIQNEDQPSPSTLSVHVFNVQLLNKNFVVPSNCQVSSSAAEAKSRSRISFLKGDWKTEENMLSEREMLRLCQAYELAKFIKSMEKSCSKNFVAYQSNSMDNIQQQDLFLIGGIFGKQNPLEQSIGECINVQDILQTFIDGLHNVFESPERIIGSDAFNTQKSFKKVFSKIKNEQIFIKLISHQLQTVAPLSQCRVEFLHGKLKFNDYWKTLLENNNETKTQSDLLQKAVLEQPRGVNLR